jgi:hypothetical protein
LGRYDLAIFLVGNRHVAFFSDATRPRALFFSLALIAGGLVIIFLTN